MPFRDCDIKQIRDLLNLPVSELYTNSCLRQLLARIEAEDAELKLDLVPTIQGYLSEIKNLNSLIANSDGSSSSESAIEKKEVKDEYSVKYQSSNISDPTAYWQRRKAELLGKLYRDLGYRKPSGMAWRVRS